MIRRIKARLAHIGPTATRYRLARRVWKEERLRGAKACTFYWVYLPAAAIAFVLTPLLALIVWSVSVPVAWLTGFRRTGEPFISGEPDAPLKDLFINAHVKFAPWRVVVPVTAIAAFVGASVAIGPRGRMGELIALVIIVVAALVGWPVYAHWAKLGEAWDRICPHLEVDSNKENVNG